MTGLTIAALVAAVLLAAMLIAALVQISGLGTKVDELAVKLKAVNTRPATPQLPPELEERLLAIEAGLTAIPPAYGRLERLVQASRREALSATAAVPSSIASPRQDPSTTVDPNHSSAPLTRREGTDAVVLALGNGGQAAMALENDVHQAATPDRVIDAYKELIARPRKNEITRWFDDLDGIPCEATDENVFKLIGRGEGARLMLVPLTERFGLVLPSALMVVDFATSFSDVLSARSATRQTFAFDADGSGTLRLVQPAMAVLVDGNWKLKAPGRLAGLASG